MIHVWKTHSLGATEWIRGFPSLIFAPWPLGTLTAVLVGGPKDGLELIVDRSAFWLDVALPLPISAWEFWAESPLPERAPSSFRYRRDGGPCWGRVRFVPA